MNHQDTKILHGVRSAPTLLGVFMCFGGAKEKDRRRNAGLSTYVRQRLTPSP